MKNKKTINSSEDPIPWYFREVRYALNNEMSWKKTSSVSLVWLYLLFELSYSKYVSRDPFLAEGSVYTVSFPFSIFY